jgi:hypothetical protein
MTGKTRYPGGLKQFFLFFIVLSLLGGCAGIDDDFTEEYKEFYADELQQAGAEPLSQYAVKGELEYRGEPPSGKWVFQNDSREIDPYSPAIVRLLLKRGAGRYIVIRHGRQEDFGVSEKMELLDQEFAYLAKLGESGDFAGKQEIAVSNDPFKGKDFFLYDIFQNATAPKVVREGKKIFFQKGDPGELVKKDLCFMIKDMDKIYFFELFTTLEHYPEDLKDFIEFLESIKAPPPKDAVDRIKEKAKQL